MMLTADTQAQFHILFDELCVAAAFMKIPCIYGLPVGGLDVHTGKTVGGQGKNVNLKHKVKYIVNQLEQNNLIQIGLSGVVHMDEVLFHAVQCMGYAEVIGRVGFFHNDERMELYCYQWKDNVVYMEYGSRGDAVITVAKDVEWLERSENEVIACAVDNPAMTMEVYKKEQGFYEQIQCIRKGNAFSNSTKLDAECIKTSFESFLDIFTNKREVCG